MGREFLSRSAEETRALAREFARRLSPGTVLLLEGELGAGKTTFVQGLAQALGVTQQVRSPTFAIMHRYRGRTDLIHIDLYRESDPVSLEDLALEEEGEGAAGKAIVVVEWPHAIVDGLWTETLTVTLEHVDESTRRIRLPER